MSFPLLFFTISNKNFEKEKDTTSSLVVIKVYAFVFVGPCPYMQCFAWLFDINGPVYYVSSLRYLSVVVFGLPLLRLHLFFLSLVPLLRLGLRTSIRWRSAWLSCTCGPLRAHFKLKVQLINMFNLPPLSPGFPPFLFLPLPCSGSFCHHSHHSLSKYLDLLLQSDFHFTSFFNESVCTFSWFQCLLHHTLNSLYCFYLFWTQAVTETRKTSMCWPRIPDLLTRKDLISYPLSSLPSSYFAKMPFPLQGR